MSGFGARDRQPRPGPPLGVVPAVWSAGWISLFAFGDWQLALPMLLLTGPVSAVGWRWRRAAKRSRKRFAAERRAEAAAVAAAAPPVSPDLHAERRVAACVVRAESSADRLEADALALVRELAARLSPLLARVRQPGIDAGVRHDVEAVAHEHLPAVLDVYLALPVEAHRVAGRDGATPADVLRTHLLLLSEGVRELEAAVVSADLARQQQLGRFLDAKFRRSDLDL